MLKVMLATEPMKTKCNDMRHGGGCDYDRRMPQAAWDKNGPSGIYEVDEVREGIATISPLLHCSSGGLSWWIYLEHLIIVEGVLPNG